MVHHITLQNRISRGLNIVEILTKKQRWKAKPNIKVLLTKSLF